MSGTRSPSRKAPAIETGAKPPEDGQADRPWPVWKLAALLYPLAAGAVGINLFMLALMGRVFGIPELSPVASVVAGLVLGVPAAWVTGRWVRRLMDEADGRR